jgi:WD40 repeat protein
VEEIALDGRRRRLLRDATRPAAVSPDGRLIAVPAFGGSAPDLKRKVVVIPRRAGAPREIDVEPDVVAWSPDGRWLAIGGTEGLQVVSADGRETRRIAEMDPPNAFTGIAWSPDSRRLAFSQDHEGYRTVDE